MGRTQRFLWMAVDNAFFIHRKAELSTASSTGPVDKKSALTCVDKGYPRYPQPLLLRLHVDLGGIGSKPDLWTNERRAA